MAISSNLARKIESDVKGSQEIAIETQVKNALSEIKNKFKYQETYLSTLYDSGFKAYLKSKTFDRPENLSKEIIAINNIKQRLIRQGLEAKKEKLDSPNLVTKAIYGICGISRNLNNNGKVKNVIKGVIDECMAIPDMLIHIVQHPIDFAKSLGNLILHPGQLLSALKQAYGDAFTQGLATPSAQYRTGRSATLIALTFIPGGLGKSLLNVGKTTLKAGKGAINKGIAKVTGKETAKNTAKQTAKQTARRQSTVAGFAGKGAEKAKQAAEATKKAERTTARVEKSAKTVEEAKATVQATENIVRNTEKELADISKSIKSLREQLKRPKNNSKIKELEDKLNLKKAERERVKGKLKTARSDLSKAKNNLANLEGKLNSAREKGLQQLRETETADKVAKASQKMTSKPVQKGKIGQGVDLIKSGLSGLPVIKQIAKIKNRVGSKLGHNESLWFRSAHPDLYASFIAKQNNLLRARSTLARNATNLEKSLEKLVKSEKAIKTMKTRISKMEEAVAKKGKIYGKTGKDLEDLLNKTKGKLNKAEADLAKKSRSHEVLGNRVSRLTSEIEKYEKALADITKKARNIKRRDHAVDAQIWASLLYTAESSKLEKEIQAAIDEIDDSTDLEEEIEEIDKLLKELEGEFSGLESGQTEFLDDSISIDLPEGVNLGEVDTSKYKIIITGMASKTGIEAINRRLATQRAENVKRIIMEKYGIKDEGQITIEIDLQSNHPDKLGEDVSKWQGARIRLQPLSEGEVSTQAVQDDESAQADDWVDQQLEGIGDS